jgi:circadian clock protein KaiB
VDKKYIIKLYVTGETPENLKAITNLKQVLERDFKGLYKLEVADLLKQPKLVEDEEIFATPTLARILPRPVRRIIGNLSDEETVLSGLNLLLR